LPSRIAAGQTPNLKYGSNRLVGKAVLCQKRIKPTKYKSVLASDLNNISDDTIVSENKLKITEIDLQQRPAYNFITGEIENRKSVV
jgi:hypothetical protein